jgi:hypothetical protein
MHFLVLTDPKLTGALKTSEGLQSLELWHIMNPGLMHQFTILD